MNNEQFMDKRNQEIGNLLVGKSITGFELGEDDFSINLKFSDGSNFEIQASCAMISEFNKDRKLEEGIRGWISNHTVSAKPILDFVSIPVIE